MLTRIAGFIFCLLGLSATPATTRGSEQANQGDVTDGCRLDLSTDKVQYAVGEPINLHILISNVNRDPIDFFGQDYFSYMVEVFLPNGDPSPKTLWGDRNVPPRKVSEESAGETVLPGQTLLDVLDTVNRGFDMTLSGKYVIVVHRSFSIEPDRKKWFEVSSNKLVVEIDDPKD
jgi:hypothetical protein